MSHKLGDLEEQLKRAEKDERIFHDQLALARECHREAQERVTRIRRELAQAMKEEIAAPPQEKQ